MDEKRRKLLIISILLSITIIVSLFWLIKEIEEVFESTEEPEVIAENTNYFGYSETDEFIYGGDKVLKKYEYIDENAEILSSLYSEFFSLVNNHVDKKLLFLPPPIALSEYEAEEMKYKEYLERASNFQYTDVLVVDSLGVLNEHKDEEKIFLNTENYLTALGYNYLVKAIIDEDMNFVELKDFQHMRKLSVYYSLLSDAGVVYKDEYAEYKKQYIYDLSRNDQIVETISVVDSENVITKQENPVVSYARVDRDVAIGGYVVRSEILIGGNSKELVVVGDNYVKEIIPLLIPYYSKITFFDNLYFDFNTVDVSDAIDNADELILIQSPESIAGTRYKYNVDFLEEVYIE